MIARLIILSALIAGIAACLNIRPASAHALDPGYLDLKSVSDSEWQVFWRVPQVQGQPMPISVALPESCNQTRELPWRLDGRAFVSRWTMSCESGLAGATIQIDGLEDTRTDVLVRFQTAPAQTAQTQRLTPQQTSFIIPENQNLAERVWTYLKLGVDHILEGVDHLLFVFALILVVRSPRRVVGAVTAFTVAHSITLGAAALRYLVIPSAFVEALIAVSIAVLAVEIVRKPSAQPGLSQTYPWSMAFLFGLLHGLGFARALLDIGLPETDIIAALFAFNLGVEMGQLLFIGCVFAAVRLYRSMRTLHRLTASGNNAARQICGYAIGSVAVFWAIERIVGA